MTSCAKRISISHLIVEAQVILGVGVEVEVVPDVPKTEVIRKKKDLSKNSKMQPKT